MARTLWIGLGIVIGLELARGNRRAAPGGADGLSIPSGEAQAAAFHLRSRSDVQGLWVEGFNLLIEGLGNLMGRITDADEERPILLILLCQAFNALRAAHLLAMQGYPSQALNLLRLPVELITAYWYLREFPAEYPKFSDIGHRTPDLRDLLAKLEARLGTDELVKRIGTIRGLTKPLHKFSHVDRLGVLALVKENGVHYRVGWGPVPDAEAFSQCGEVGVALIGNVVDAVNDLNRTVGSPTVSGAAALAARFLEVFPHHKGTKAT